MNQSPDNLSSIHKIPFKSVFRHSHITMHPSGKSEDYDVPEMIPMHMLPLGKWNWQNFTSHIPPTQIRHENLLFERLKAQGHCNIQEIHRSCWKEGKHWNSLPGEVVGVSSLEIRKVRLEGLWATWSSKRKVTLPMIGDLEPDIFSVTLWCSYRWSEVHEWPKMTSTCLQMKLAYLWDEAKWLQSPFNTLTLRSIQLPKSPSLMLFTMAKGTKEV